jgi:hypothetical protein
VAVQPTIRTNTDKVAPDLPRAERGLRLFEEHGRDILRLAPNVYRVRVPSSDGQRSYDVLYGEREECPCPDHQYRGVACVHIIAIGIHIAKSRGATVRALAALEEDLAHELLGDAERQELRDRIIRIRRRLNFGLSKRS